MGLSDLAYGAYERRLLKNLDTDRLPRHVGAIVDGNRRWAKDARKDLEQGYLAGAAKVDEFLDWCHDLGVGTVTFWVLSTDNLQRPDAELVSILAAVEGLVERLAADGRWRVRLLGSLDLLPVDSRSRLVERAGRSPENGEMQVNVCVGYGGRQELTDAMRSLLLDEAAKGRSLEDVAHTLEVDHIAEHLYTKGQPDPDLVIRTSGEQRLSGFLLWQSVHSEFYFSDVLWPAFRRVDLLRAMRSYASRERRFGA
ncbi:UDP pyrophosphate synthase [Aeromicrobium sp. Root495]|uniref:polyprenyl diphosphate synthase n=1 Tax=Aeromicrobium sp. Root495 TaxID=1736550 RepID=UPI0006F64584|nr:polyprenyl diphosphate synthase [Aeromicrobium sp. Root495]KQY58545.1 UDP pyrophosphate synthase [Aeromicrobium sp. Root495]RYJ07022.1 MAG: di-trans,poly-cis-decaprenylcistransferase [Actinomycetales bacterium]